MEKIYITVSFQNTKKSYFFYTIDKTIVPGDKVLVETVVGKELGTVSAVNISINNHEYTKEIKPIISKASAQDIKIAAANAKLALKANEIFERAIENLKLDMKLISSEYTFDCSKILFVYASDDRVDFRDLLKILAAELRCRIELRQINSRERAQQIGGIGVCGLPLCCTTFFRTFEGISLNRAKNQMLAINIPKLSGQCGKLMCCLKYEDDLYTQEKQKFPKLGSKVLYNGQEYKLTSFNIFTKICTIQNDEDVEFVELKELKVRK